MLRDNYITKIDEKGRIKLPAEMRAQVESKWGNLLYITSLDGIEIRIYPLPVWEEIERRLEKAPSMNPAIIKFTDRSSYYGRSASFDRQGRILIHPLLRQTASLNGEVVLLGKNNHFTLWNHGIFQDQRLRDPIQQQDREILASLGI